MDLSGDIEKVIKSKKSAVNGRMYYFRIALNPICMLEKKFGLNETQQSAQ